MKRAFTVYYDEDDNEHRKIVFSPAFDRNNYPSKMVTKLDVLQDVIEDLIYY